MRVRDRVSRCQASPHVNSGTDWGAIMAGSTLMTIPVIVFFLFVQGRMTTGLVSSAMKG